MIKRLIALSNILDSRGLTKEADYLDRLISLAADEEDDNVITLPFVKPKKKEEEGDEMTLFTEEGNFVDYDEALSELMASVGFLTMPMSQRDWQNFGRETIKQQISGFDSLAPAPELRDVSKDSREGTEEGREQTQKEMLQEAEVADSEGNYTDYSYAVEVTLRLLNFVASLDVLPSNIHDIALEHQAKVQGLMDKTYLGKAKAEEPEEERGNILSFPAREGKPDMDSLDHMSLDFSEEDED